MLSLLWLLPAHAASQTTPRWEEHWEVAAYVAPAAVAAIESQGMADVIVLLRSEANLPALPRTVDKATRGTAVTRALRQHAALAQASLCDWLDRRGVQYQAFYIVNALLLKADAALLAQLATRSDVAAITNNPEVAMPPVQWINAIGSMLQVTTATPWGVAHIGAPDVWAMGYQGEGVVVAGQDTGYDWDHPALKAQYRGWDGTSVNHNYNWHDAIHTSNSSCSADSTEPCDDHGHGTHTMGTIVGQASGADPIGVAPAAKWIGCRNMNRGVGMPASYTECFEFFLAPYAFGVDPTEGDPLQAPDVINNSWSCPASEGCDEIHIALLDRVVANIRAAGIMVVASAGNLGAYGCDTVDAPPGMYDAATTVGATDISDIIAGFSSRGSTTGLSKPDLSAPGVNIYSSLRGGGYGTLSGTSMSAPHVTGVAALVWSAYPYLLGQITETERLLLTTAVPRLSSQCGDASDAVPNSVYGWGRLDALAAVQTALKPSPPFTHTLYLPILIGEFDEVH